jgi:hypothetical protein
MAEGHASDEVARERRRDAARRMAEAYQVVLRADNGGYVGRGLELPAAAGRGTTAKACLNATRAALAEAVLAIVESGGTPPAPEFPASPPTRGARRLRAARWARWLLWAASGVCAVATLAVAAMGAETVLVSGPTIAVLGVAVMVLGWVGRYGWAVGLGASHLAICILFVVMVNAFRLSPRSAYAPFLGVGVPYALGLAAVTVLASRRSPREERPWECDGCGYLLVGLNEPRCPECGRGFDPRRWEGVAVPGMGTERTGIAEVG